MIYVHRGSVFEFELVELIQSCMYTNTNIMQYIVSVSIPT